MKKLVVLSLVVLFVTPALAQLDYGVRLGLNHAIWMGDDVAQIGRFFSADPLMANGTQVAIGGLEATGEFSFAGGVFVGYQLFNRLGVQLEVNYTENGSGYLGSAFFQQYDIMEEAVDHVTIQQRNSYVQVPLLIKYTVLSNAPTPISITAGPYYAMHLDSRNKVNVYADRYDDYEGLEKVTVEDADYGVIAGLGLGIFNNISLDLRYQYGLAEVVADSDVYNSVISAMVSYSF